MRGVLTEEPTKAETEKRKSIKNPYKNAHDYFHSQTYVIRELNKKLSESITQMIKNGKENVQKRAKELDKESAKQFQDFLEETKKLIIKTKEGETITDKPLLQLSGKPATLLWDAVNSILFPQRFNAFIRDMSLIYLVAEFESFLRKILEIAYELKPEILMTCQKSITFEELVKFGSIKNIRNEIIEKETAIVNQDLGEINKYLKRKFRIDLSKLVDWEEFRERFCRRNIIIHNSGLPDKLYRLRTGYKGRVKRLTVSGEYLNDSLDLFEKAALKISEQFNQKIQ